MQAPETFDLTVEEDTKPAAAAPELFDLTDENAVLPPPKKRTKRNQQSSSTKKIPPPSATDVINLEEAASKSPDLEEQYKSALGPIRMDFCETFDPPHSFASSPKSVTRTFTHKLYQELLEYKLNLPINTCSSIFVRAMESRLDLLRVIISGPESTPYAHGLYVFDVCLKDYPVQAPQVKYRTTVRINPNLYQCGKVCLSLLGTWSGPGWVSHQSTLLQVLVSIQGLVLVQDPYFNEPGYTMRQRGALQQSAKYNATVQNFTLQYSMLEMLKLRQYPEFHTVIRRHFWILHTKVRAVVNTWKQPAAKIKQLSARLDAIVAEEEEEASKKKKPPPAEVITL